MTFPLMKDNTISALPEGPKQKQNPAEPGGTDHILPLEGKATKRHLKSTSGTENCTTHCARSPAAHFDEFVYSAQVTLPEESDPLRLHCHSATSPLGLSARSNVAHLDEFVYSGQVTLPEESDQLRLHCHSASAPRATLLTLTSSSTLDRSHYLRSQISSGYIATRPQRPEPRCSP